MVCWRQKQQKLPQVQWTSHGNEHPFKTQSQGCSEWVMESEGDGGKGFSMQFKENVSTNNASWARASAQAGMNWNQNYRGMN